jgi:hypothetical protein
MSHIDTINHSVVGTFAGISVYHTLQDIDGKDYDFSATPKNLVIGGGSGEHPGMVIQDLDFCVWEFLTALTELQGKEIEKAGTHSKYESHFNAMRDMAKDSLAKVKAAKTVDSK